MFFNYIKQEYEIKPKRCEFKIKTQLTKKGAIQDKRHVVYWKFLREHSIFLFKFILWTFQFIVNIISVNCKVNQFISETIACELVVCCIIQLSLYALKASYITLNNFKSVTCKFELAKNKTKEKVPSSATCIFCHHHIDAVSVVVGCFFRLRREFWYVTIRLLLVICQDFVFCFFLKHHHLICKEQSTVI